VEGQVTVFELSQADERVIRTYQCTRLQRLFAPATLGYLTITNRRIVYHSASHSRGAKSLLLSEMPIQDAAGVSVYMGNALNWLHYIGFAVVLLAVSSALEALLPSFFTSWLFGLLLMVPLAFQRVYRSRWLSEEARDAIGSVLRRVSGSQTGTADAEAWSRRLRLLFLAGVAILAWDLVHSAVLGYVWFRASPIAVLLLAIVYLLLYLATFGRQGAFSLAISSRSAQGRGIYIPGNTFRLFTRVDRAVIESPSGRPGMDASALAVELGALLTDVQMLGDLGIEKWTARGAAGISDEQESAAGSASAR